MSPETAQIFGGIAPLMAIVSAIGVGGWVLTTWMRVKHGYPLEGHGGEPIYPRDADETVERIRLLSQENAQLRAELGSIKDRLGNVERIVTDGSRSLAADIDALRLTAN